eukprot:2791201-Pyramimonas_sp.AAC.1
MHLLRGAVSPRPKSSPGRNRRLPHRRALRLRVPRTADSSRHLATMPGTEGAPTQNPAHGSDGRGQQATGDYATSESQGLKRRLDREQKMSEDSRAAEAEQQRRAEAGASAAADAQRPAPMSPPTVTSLPPSLSEYDFDETMRRPEQ